MQKCIWVFTIFHFTILGFWFKVYKGGISSIPFYFGKLTWRCAESSMNERFDEKTCCCEGCSDSKEALLQQIGKMAEDYTKEGKSLIQILHIAQGMYTYLPIEVQELVADKTGVPLSRVSGVVSFYSFFTTKPRGKHTIRVCLGTACYVRGGKQIIDRLEEILKVSPGETTADGVFTFEVARCIGACGLAPAMSIDNTVYKQVNPKSLEEILDPYYTKGGDK